MYDVLIPLAEKDFNKFRFAYNSIVKYLSGFADIHCISPVPFPKHLKISNVIYHLDKDVIDFDFNLLEGKTKARTGWYRQQFIELFQNVTADDYLVSDSDNIYTKKIEIFRNGKPLFLLGEDQEHAPYFELTKKLFGFGREFPYSFINEIMLFKRPIIKELVASTGLTNDGFFALIVAELNRVQDNSGMAQYEMYGNYVTKHHPNMYGYEYLPFINMNKHREWTDAEIERELRKYANTKYTMIKLHSWSG